MVDDEHQELMQSSEMNLEKDLPGKPQFSDSQNEELLEQQRFDEDIERRIKTSPQGFSSDEDDEDQQF